MISFVRYHSTPHPSPSSPPPLHIMCAIFCEGQNIIIVTTTPYPYIYVSFIRTTTLDDRAFR